MLKYLIAIISIMIIFTYQFDIQILNLTLHNIYQSDFFFSFFVVLFFLLFLLSFKKPKNKSDIPKTMSDFEKLKNQRSEQIRREDILEDTTEETSPVNGEANDEGLVFKDESASGENMENTTDRNNEKEKYYNKEGIKERNGEIIDSDNKLPVQLNYTKEEIERMLEEKLEKKMQEISNAARSNDDIEDILERRRREEEEERRKERKIVHQILCEDGSELNLPIKLNKKEEFILKELKKIGSLSNDELEQILLKNFEQVGLLNGIMKRLKKKMDANQLDWFDIQCNGGVIKYVWIKE